MRSRASERGAIAPASLLAAAIVAIAIGVAGYAMTSGPSQQSEQPSITSTLKPSATPTKTAPPKKPAKPAVSTPPPVDRGAFRVAVFNSSRVQGLAARTATKARTTGWNVVTTAQWGATAPTTSTIFYPTSMKDAAQQLGKDMGITELQPTVPPAQPDQLTIVLSSDYSE